MSQANAQGRCAQGRCAHGRVTLVGAGPGDPDLLTLKAVQALQRATVVLVDDLVDEAVLQHAPPHARIINVGKRGGCASTPQRFIERLMVRQARLGEQVVRLKGGDPFVFGRGGEEVQALRSCGIDVTVVPGITSGLAAAHALGVGWTHRDHAHGVVLVTGHGRRDGGQLGGKSGDGGGLEWPRLAQLAQQGLTLVVYMGVTHLPEIATGLLQGLPPNTPAALVQSASTAHEQRVVCALADVAACAEREAIQSPAILIVGNILASVAAPAMASADGVTEDIQAATAPAKTGAPPTEKAAA
jgi:uroporphyrin-III C-methyltransferase